MSSIEKVGWDIDSLTERFYKIAMEDIVGYKPSDGLRAKPFSKVENNLTLDFASYGSKYYDCEKRLLVIGRAMGKDNNHEYKRMVIRYNPDESMIPIVNKDAIRYSIDKELSMDTRWMLNYIIIGNQNAITYKEFFPLLMNNKVWIGAGFPGNVAFFASPYEDKAASSHHKDGMIRVSGVMWFTNLDIKKRHEELILVRRYSAEEYPHYDNYDAINVDVTANIPCDYAGVMGVPITFMDKYNPDQFEILGMDGQECSPPTKTYKSKSKVVNGQRMRSNTGTMGCVIRTTQFGKGTYFDVGYPVKACYKRVFIRNKHPEAPKET